MTKKDWPFDVVPVPNRSPLLQAQIAFLEQAHQKGFLPSMDGADFHASNDEERAAWIIRRAVARGNVWEIVLSQSDQKVASAFVNDFSIAGDAVISWLSGMDPQLAVEGCRKHLVVPPGASESHYVNSMPKVAVRK